MQRQKLPKLVSAADSDSSPGVTSLADAEMSMAVLIQTLESATEEEACKLLREVRCRLVPCVHVHYTACLMCRFASDPWPDAAATTQSLAADATYLVSAFNSKKYFNERIFHL